MWLAVLDGVVDRDKGRRHSAPWSTLTRSNSPTRTAMDQERWRRSCRCRPQVPPAPPAAANMSIQQITGILVKKLSYK